MAVSYPIVPKILGALSGKSLLLADLVLQFFLSWFCARQANIDLLIAASFVIGFLKGFLMLWVIRRIKFIFSPRMYEVNSMLIFIRWYSEADNSPWSLLLC